MADVVECALVEGLLLDNEQMLGAHSRATRKSDDLFDARGYGSKEYANNPYIGMAAVAVDNVVVVDAGKRVYESARGPNTDDVTRGKWDDDVLGERESR